MPSLNGRNPSLRHHKASGQAVVTLNGRDFYLGPWNSAASKAEYKRRICEWHAAGGVHKTDCHGLTVMELAAAFKRHSKTYYVDADGLPTTEYRNYATLAARLGKAYGHMLAAEFGPRCLKAFRQMLIDEGHSRTYINHQIGKARHIFKWGVENELVPAGIIDALKCVTGLRFGKSGARETEPVLPVHDAFVDAVLPYVAPQVRAMIELQRITGMRSGEVCRMRSLDLNMTGEHWTYTPERHKTTYRGHERVVYIGPKAQAVLRPWLRTNLSKPLFSPAEAEQQRREAQHAKRKTPLSCGNRPGTNRNGKPRKAAGEAYTTSSYLRAVKYGIAKCNREREKRSEQPIPSWHPHQLRHNAATLIAREFGLEAARVILGHKHAAITQVYAAADTARAIEVVAKIG